MRSVWFTALVCGGFVLVAQAQDTALVPADSSFAEPAATTNINSRYLVEDIQITGAARNRLSADLTQKLRKLVGERFNQEALDDLIRRIKKELHARTASLKLTRGAQPEHVRVVIEIGSRKGEDSDFHMSKFLYHGKQAWSAKLFGEFDIARTNSLLVGVVSDQDELIERYSGIAAGFENRKVGSDRVRLRFLFETYHQQWNGATLRALEANPELPGIYRTRNSFQPVATFVVNRQLKVSAGVNFRLFQTQYPVARHEAANALTAGLRYGRKFEDVQGNKHEIRGRYDLRAGTRSLDSDYVYSRHLGTVGYKVAGARQAVVNNFTAGYLSGRAPLFERYSLGNSTTLRGWNKFDLSPAGGGRVIHNSLEYRHAIDSDINAADWIVFYDTGAVWSEGQSSDVKHSVGFGARYKQFFAALAFPVKSGRMAPVFTVGAFFTEGATF